MKRRQFLLAAAAAVAPGKNVPVAKTPLFKKRIKFAISTYSYWHFEEKKFPLETVIEAAAAGIPMIAANVGGIPEIFGPFTDALFAPGNPAAMADAIARALDDPAATQERAKSLRERILMHFSQKAMVEGVLAGYRDAFANR